FGKGIARYFMVPYNNKFWTVSTKKLTREWVDGFIPVPSLQQVVEGGIGRNNNQFGYNIHFWYPKSGGISSVPSALARGVKNIRINREATGIDLKKKRIKINSSGWEDFDTLVSTIPLPELSGLIVDLPSHVSKALGKLRWNSILNLNLGLASGDMGQGHWVYFPQKNISFFRVGFPHNFSSNVTPSGKSSLYAEVSYSSFRPINKDRIAGRILKDLKITGIIRQKDKICASDLNDIKYGYPIYDAQYKLARQTAVQYLLSKNLIPCGRYGSWRYMSMEDVILEARDVSHYLLNKHA
ncbi:MAG: hypothetical protein PHN57_07200, partial [Candidatus Omnitrophica bacterium]|nr:hypothetical protein [Candidatus Omnitrophota bacterium]